MNKLITKIMCSCGLRVGEINNLKKEDINLKEGLIHIKDVKSPLDNS